MLEEIGVIRKIDDFYHATITIDNCICIELILSDIDFDRVEKNEIIPVTEKVTIPRYLNDPETFLIKAHKFSLSQSRTAYIIDLDRQFKRLSISKYQKKLFDLGQVCNIPISEITQPPLTHEEE